MFDNHVVYCRICGRRLRNPISRARGIGPVCARGGSRAVRRRANARASPRSSYVPASSHLTAGMSSMVSTEESDEELLVRLVNEPLKLLEFQSVLAKMQRGRAKATLRLMRSLRFHTRQPFCSGTFFVETGEQCVFEPVGDDLWREAHFPGRLQKSYQLESYLKQIGVLALSWDGASSLQRWLNQLAAEHPQSDASLRRGASFTKEDH